MFAGENRFAPAEKDLSRGWSLETSSSKREPVTRAASTPATVTHSRREQCTTSISAESCRDFRSKQRCSRETSLKVLAESSIARVQNEAWRDELHESQHKEDAILEEVQDTMQNLRDRVKESHAKLQSLHATYKNAFQSVKSYLNKWL